MKLSFNDACSMNGVTNWLVPVTQSIKDTDRGIFFRRSTSNITGINTVTFSEGLNAGPYINASYSETSVFTIATNDDFQNYEELETVASMGVTVVFRCSGGSLSTLVFFINIIDTNNNAPQFRPNSVYLFKIAPPVPPGFLITDCINDIIARDIDLTTEKIVFEIQQNPYFEISYNGSTTPKEFKAILKTSAFIRRLPEPITLWISATDVDRTTDPPLTTNGTIRIEADTEFEFPDDLIFSGTFYLGNYSDDHQVLLQKEIYLQQGYDENVTFTLEGDNKDHFEIIQNGNSLNLNVTNPIPIGTIAQTQIYLIIRASRELTSGTTATIILSFQARTLAFKSLTYSGFLVNSDVALETMELSVGYDEDVTFKLTGEYSTYFATLNTGNQVTLKVLDELPETIISENSLLIFNLFATANNTSTATTTIILEIIKEDTVTPVFSQNIYYSTYSSASLLNTENVSLIQGLSENVTFRLSGDHAQFFNISRQENNISIFLQSSIPREIIYNEKVLIFNIIAEKPLTVGANAAISISFPPELTDPVTMRFSKNTYIGKIENNVLTIETLVLIEGFLPETSFSLIGEIIKEIPPTTATFEQPYYYGEYSNEIGLQFTNTIRLKENLNDNVTLELVGNYSEWFTLIPADEGASLATISPLPSDILAHNRQLIFIISAEMYNNMTIARSTIFIVLTDDKNIKPILSFERTHYIGTINDTTLELQPISLINDFSEDVLFSLHGELAIYFTNTSNGKTVSITLPTPIPEESLPDNRIIILELQASSSGALSTYAIIVLQVLQHDEVLDSTNVLQFAETYYVGFYNEVDGFIFNNNITLAKGYDDSVEFSLHGENSIWFTISPLDEGVTISINGSLSSAVLANNTQLIFEINANRPGNPLTARSTIIIILTKEIRTSLLGFEKRNYIGSVDNVTVNLEAIRLVEGFSTNVEFSLIGEFSIFFTKMIDGATVFISLQNGISEEILSNNRVIILELMASAPEAIPSYTSIILEVKMQSELPIYIELLEFNQTYYTGVYSITEGLIFDNTISLTEGSHERVDFALEGDHSIWFALEPTENGLILILTSPIPLAILSENWQLIFIATARKPESFISARSTIVISLPSDSDDAYILFDKLHYSGVWRGGDISHESIFVSGYNGTRIEIYGDYVTFFTAQINAGIVTVQLRGTTPPPIDKSHVVLELRVPGAGSVLILDVIQQETPGTPTVRFSSASYVMQVDNTQTGLIGQVAASADNGEDIIYSLLVDQEDLKERLSVNKEGEVHLFAPAGIGVHTFRVLATTQLTMVNDSAVVLLIVEGADKCTNEEGVPPLILLDRDEESPHENLVVLNKTTHENCQFVMINHWPVDQAWLYVDENGLHTRSIDREHETIAFMALSQIQVELILHCQNDEPTTRTKRSLNTDVRLNPLGPYDYGPLKWALTDSISYNVRRSFVNLIVNDINDNNPIFELKETEPIAVGYPIPDLVETVSPRALAELKATDADVGENAALVYWSPEPALAVSSSTGYVHVRSNADLENGDRFTIYATDRNGLGHTGSIDIVIRLLNIDRIAVITIRGAFLEDENTVLANLSTTLGYEVKTLRSKVIPVNSKPNVTANVYRKGSQIDDSGGAVLQLYIYGLIDRDPVDVGRLTTDINNNIIMANLVTALSLQDHLERREACTIPEQDTGLLAATIALSIVLFILIVVLVAWLFLKWRKKRSYDQFSDENSLTSRDQIQQPPKGDELDKPRLNLDQLKRSEKRLQEMLDVPVDKPDTSEPQKEIPIETIVNVAPEQRMPLVIQSIDKLKDAADASDDEDEFGETKTPRRKSVVTFNENVEKIIHLEDNHSDGEYEVYKF
ncbi:unnamed protein product, partial [Iphiclides podalirius]